MSGHSWKTVELNISENHAVKEDGKINDDVLGNQDLP